MRLSFALLLGITASAPGAAVGEPVAVQARAHRAFRPVRSPEVRPDGSVTFRFRAPDAKTVSLLREGRAPERMKAGEDGVWSFSTAPLAPGYYVYSFLAGDVPLADPSNEQSTEVVVGGHESLLHVPGPATLPWEARDLPHGTLHRHAYTSAAIGEARSYWVYTPPGFEAAGAKRYPLLYLLHGVMNTATAWLTAGRADVILDNLIAEGRAKPMIVVFPAGYGFANAPDQIGELFTAATDQRKVLEVFTITLLEEIGPQVERAYPVEPGREARAIAGLSMGGAQALYVGLNHPDRFAWIGAFSAAVPLFAAGYGACFPAPGTGAKPRLLWLSVGREDFLLAPNRHLGAWLRSKGLTVTAVENPGLHEWPVWHRDLAAFAPLLFQAQAN